MIVATMQALYNTVWGQCSEGLRSKLRSGTSYATYATTSNCIEILKAIRAEMTGFKGRNYLASSRPSVMREFYLMTQGKHQSNQEYFDAFNMLSEGIEDTGAQIGIHPSLIDSCARKFAQT